MFAGAKANEGVTSGHKLVAAASKTESGLHGGTSLLAKRPKYSSSLLPEKSQTKYEDVGIDCEWLAFFL